MSVKTGIEKKESQKDILKLINGTPYLHQIRAFEFVQGIFENNVEKNGQAGAALFMEMGTGKTLVAIMVVAYLYTIKGIKRVLVVAPKTVFGVWQGEVQKFANFEYSLTVLKGTSKKKQEQIKDIPEAGLQILLINYESTWRILDDLTEYDADLVIADEGHRIKNHCAKQSQALHQFGDRAKYKLLLTGTPITNHEMDIFSEYRFLDSTVFGTQFWDFRIEYFWCGGYRDHEWFFYEYKEKKFKEKIHSIAFRIKKEECLDLPDIVDNNHFVYLEKNVYRKYRLLAKGHCAFAINVLKRITMLTILTGGFVKDGKNYKMVSKAKMEALEGIIESLVKEEGKKVVILGQYTHELNAIQNLLKDKKIDYVIVHGKTKDPESEIKRFQENDGCKVFVGQIKVVREGISLNSADTMIFYSLGYSVSEYDQAKGRIHRKGQTKKCHFIYLCCKGTIDEKIIQSLSENEDARKRILDDYRRGLNPFITD